MSLTVTLAEPLPHHRTGDAKSQYLPHLVHPQVKYLNNVIEADHGKLKRLMKQVLGFKSLKTTYATLKGFEVMLALKKQKIRAFPAQDGIHGEIRLSERAFGLGGNAIAEARRKLNVMLRTLPLQPKRTSSYPFTRCVDLYNRVR